jgi:response regulator RpfG family c-di-GMP phosphodiesterase
MNEVEFPTILVVGHDEDCLILVDGLQADGYFVLIAENYDDALRMASIHSRQIHLVLVHGNMNASDLAEILKPFRLEIPVLHVDGVPRIDTRVRVRELVKV